MTRAHGDAQAVSGARGDRRRVGRAPLDALGLACYIAYSYLFWDSPLLLDRADVATPGLLLLTQGLFTCLASLALMFAWGHAAPLRRNAPLLAALAGGEALAVALAAQGDGSGAALAAVVGFSLSGGCSVMRLGWEERMSVRGVAYAALVACAGYVIGTAIYCVGVLVPASAGVLLMGALPELSLVALLARERGHPDDDVVLPDPSLEQIGPRASLRACFERVPWRIPAFVALSYACFGATRMSSLSESISSGTTGGALTVSTAMLACAVGIVLAYLAYRRGVRVAILIAVPIMAVAGLFNLRAGGNIAVLCVANVGVEITKYIMLFLMIDVIIKDGAPALPCLALLRFAQWGGSVLGQAVADALATGMGALLVILLTLMAALLAIMGAMPEISSLPVWDARADAAADADEDGGGREDAPARDRADAGGAPPAGDLATQVERAAARYALSPRETEVLAIWATGRSSRSIEKSLFIAQSTVKTHLNHIYAKTGTANRQELLQLLSEL
ncbi:helix-turn-helix transcriptional regulator [bacterium]|nr:helix-turn-helix transcriptional regulator [bacterium]